MEAKNKQLNKSKSYTKSSYTPTKEFPLIKLAVRRVVKEYSETLKKLAASD